MSVKFANGSKICLFVFFKDSFCFRVVDLNTGVERDSLRLLTFSSWHKCSLLTL